MNTNDPAQDGWTGRALIDATEGTSGSYDLKNESLSSGITRFVTKYGGGAAKKLLGTDVPKARPTKELIAEKQEEITFQEKELLDYNQKRFGPNGDLIVQKAVLVKPIQDRVYNAVQKIAVERQYDLILDKSEGITIIFADPKLDKSDDVLKELKGK